MQGINVHQVKYVDSKLFCAVCDRTGHETSYCPSLSVIKEYIWAESGGQLDLKQQWVKLEYLQPEWKDEFWLGPQSQLIAELCCIILGPIMLILCKYIINLAHISTFHCKPLLLGYNSIYAYYSIFMIKLGLNVFVTPIFQG